MQLWLTPKAHSVILIIIIYKFSIALFPAACVPKLQALLISNGVCFIFHGPGSSSGQRLGHDLRDDLAGARIRWSNDRRGSPGSDAVQLVRWAGRFCQRHQTLRAREEERRACALASTGAEWVFRDVRQSSSVLLWKSASDKVKKN